MTLADRLKPTLRGVRAIPGKLGLRPHRVFIKTRTWSGEYSGPSIVSEVEITEGDGQPPKVRQMGEEKLALSGLPAGTLEIGPMTTFFENVGIDPLFIRGKAATAQNLDTMLVRVSGPMGDAVYSLKRITLDRAMHWKMVVSPQSEVA